MSWVIPMPELPPFSSDVLGYTLDWAPLPLLVTSWAISSTELQLSPKNNS